MTKQPNDVQLGFRAFGKAAGFQSRSATLYSVREGVSLALNLQKSNYSRNYYINVGFWLHENQDKSFRPLERWGAVVRVGELAPAMASAFVRLLDLERDTTGAEADRAGSLQALLTNEVLPRIDPIRDISTLRSAIDAGVFPPSHVKRVTREALGL